MTNKGHIRTLAETMSEALMVCDDIHDQDARLKAYHENKLNLAWFPLWAIREADSTAKEIELSRRVSQS